MLKELTKDKWRHTYKMLREIDLSKLIEALFEPHIPYIQTQKGFYLNMESYSFLGPSMFIKVRLFKYKRILFQIKNEVCYFS